MVSSHPARTARVPHGGEIAFKPKNRVNLSGFVDNLSEKGMLLFAEQRIAVGTWLIIYLPLELESRKALCMLSGTVVRSTKTATNEKGFSYGVAFDSEIAPSSRQLLQDFVSYKQTGKVPDRRLSSYRD